MITAYKKDGSSIRQLLQNNDINIQNIDDRTTVIKFSNGLQIVYGYVSIKNRTWEHTAQLYFSSGYILYPDITPKLLQEGTLNCSVNFLSLSTTTESYKTSVKTLLCFGFKFKTFNLFVFIYPIDIKITS